MALFVGTGADETIIPSFVSPTVSASPSGTFPSALVDLVNAGGGRDTIDTGGGDDFLFGEDGDDFLRGGLGGDRLDGGAGVDTVSYTESALGVDVSLRTGSGFFGNAQGDLLFGIENLNGSAHSDTLSGDAVANALSGSDGNDSLQGREGADTISGGSGTDAASYLDSSGGVIVNLATGACLFGHAAGDQLSGIENLVGSGAHGDALVGDAGANSLSGMGGGDSLQGAGGSDGLFGGDGDDSLLAGDGDDLLLGGNGADALDGGAGIDRASYDESFGVGVDLLLGTGTGGAAEGDRLTAIEHLDGSNFTDTLFGDALANTLDGRGGADTLNGRSGNDTLRGSGGTDALGGGPGNDRLEGGGALDRFDFVPGDGVDLVLDFTDGVDRLRFTGFGPAFDTPAEIVAAASAFGTSTRIVLPDPGAASQTVVVLSGFDLASLSAADFA